MNVGKNSRRNFLRTVALGALSIIAGGCAKTFISDKNPQQPNILFFFTDDQRFNTLGALSNQAVKTPNLDKLVLDGMTFKNAYYQGSNISAVCAPSRAMLLTGRTFYHLPKTFTRPWGFKGAERGKCPYITLPEVLRKAGYATFATGKWHQEPPTFRRGFTHGGNVFFGGMSDHLKVPVHDFDPTGEYPKEKSYMVDKFSSELFADAAVDFLNNYKEDQPFFAYVSFTAPHDPRMAPQEYVDQYPLEDITVPKNFLPGHPFDNGQLMGRDEKTAAFPRTPEIVKKEIAGYYAMITHLDAQVGRIMEALKRSGKADNTIMIFAGDNGLAVGQHGLMGKQNLYDHSVHIPFVFCGPGIPHGESREALCYLHDLFPTLCDLLDLPVPESVESKSLVGIISGKEEEVYDSLFFTYADLQRAVRDKRYKLIEYDVKGVKTTQLFDLKTDPWELNNLAADPKYSGHLERLRQLLLRWKEDVDDPEAKFYPH